jgi:hypothetical protein
VPNFQKLFWEGAPESKGLLIQFVDFCMTNDKSKQLKLGHRPIILYIKITSSNSRSHTAKTGAVPSKMIDISKAKPKCVIKYITYRPARRAGLAHYSMSLSTAVLCVQLHCHKHET